MELSPQLSAHQTVPIGTRSVKFATAWRGGLAGVIQAMREQ